VLGTNKIPTTITLRNRYPTVKPSKRSNLVSRLKELNYSSLQTIAAWQSAGIARAPDRPEQVPLVLLAPSRAAGYNSRVPPVSQTIRVKVLFFGRLKELTGHAEDSIEFADAMTIEQLFAVYATRIPDLAKYRSSLVASRNQEFAAWDTPLRTGDEVAFLPPVSGG